MLVLSLLVDCFFLSQPDKKMLPITLMPKNAPVITSFCQFMLNLISLKNCYQIYKLYFYQCFKISQIK